MKQVKDYKIQNAYGQAYFDWYDDKITKEEFYEIVKERVPEWKQLNLIIGGKDE